MEHDWIARLATRTMPNQTHVCLVQHACNGSPVRFPIKTISTNANMVKDFKADIIKIM